MHLKCIGGMGKHTGVNQQLETLAFHLDTGLLSAGEGHLGILLGRGPVGFTRGVQSPDTLGAEVQSTSDFLEENLLS